MKTQIDSNSYVFPEALLRKAVIPTISASWFTPETHGELWPFIDSDVHWIKRVTPGWTITGQTKNSSLVPRVRRIEDGETYIALMFRDPDGFDVWFHLLDYPWVFVTS